MKLMLLSVLTIVALGLLVMPEAVRSQGATHPGKLTAARHSPRSTSPAYVGRLGCAPRGHCPALSAVSAVAPPRGQRSCYAPETPGTVCMYGRGFFPHEWVTIDYNLTIHFLPTGNSRVQTLNPTSGQAPGITCLTIRTNGCRYTFTDARGYFGPLPVNLTYFGTNIPQDYQSMATGVRRDRQSTGIPHVVVVAPPPQPAPSPTPPAVCNITCG
jgi:hypothetical protein